MKITLEALQMLDAIAVRGSFAAAADALNRVPSALTHAVRKLEDDLGFALFQRSGRRAQLTPAGRSLLDEGRQLLRAAGEMECKARRVATGWEAGLSIAVDGMLDAGSLLPLVADFYAENRGTSIRLATEVLGGCWDALSTGRADLVIGAPGEAPPGCGFATRSLASVEFLFCVAPGHPLATETEPIASTQIRKHRAIAIADTSRALVARSSGLLDGQDVLTVPDMGIKLAAQHAGLGCGYLPAALAHREVAAGRLVIREVAATKPHASLHLAWRENHEGRALRWFLGRLADDTIRDRVLQNLM